MLPLGPIDQPIPATIWLGQSVDTSSLCSQYRELSNANFLTSVGCAIRRPSLVGTHFNSAIKKKLGLTGPLMLDSGGFALSKGPRVEWTVRRVGDLIEQTDADIFVSLDSPPSPQDKAADRKAKIIWSMGNFTTLQNRFPDKLIMPVVHGRNLDEIELSLELINRTSPNPRWIGLGGVVPLLQKRRVKGLLTAPETFIAHALALIRSLNERSLIHVFGAGGTRTFPAVVALGAHSGDSIGWRQAAGFGSIFLPLRSQRVVRWNLDNSPPRKVLDESDMAALELCRCPICVNASHDERLRIFHRHFHSRSVHNAWTLVHQSRYWPRSLSDLRQNIENGSLGEGWASAVADSASSRLRTKLGGLDRPVGLLHRTTSGSPYDPARSDIRRRRQAGTRERDL